jgi:hypothetical protein
MLKGLGIAAGIFVGFFILGVVIIQFYTRDPEFMSQDWKKGAQAAAADSGAATGSGLQVKKDDPDAPAGPTSSSSASSTAAAPDTLDDTPRAATSGSTAPVKAPSVSEDDARNGMQSWFGGVMAGGFVSAALWLLFAWRTFATGGVGGAHGGRRAEPYWWGGVLLMLILGIAASLLSLRHEDLGSAISSVTRNLMAAFCALWAIIAYHLACAFGAPLILRPSVPFATAVVPHGSRSR